MLATFIGGERSCPSVASVVVARSCLSKLMSSPFSFNAILADCQHQTVQLGCEQTANDQLVSLQAIYDLTVPGQTTDKCMIAKVKFASQGERFVDVTSLLFKPENKLPSFCHTLPSVRIRTLPLPLDDQTLTRSHVWHKYALG